MKKKGILLLGLLVSLLSLTGCASQQKGSIVNAVGSSALQLLVENVGDLYNEKNPDVFINVQGGGTGTGLAQIQAGAVDIGNSDLFAEEKKGINADKLVDHQVAVVGITPVINKNNPVKNISMKQLQDIFSGKITNWKEVGGKDLPILVINRAQGSGTRVVFENIVLKKEQALNAQEQDSNGMVRKLVASTEGAISYLAFSYVNKDVKNINIDNVEPTQKNVTTDAWKIWAYEHMYTQKNASKDTQNFLKFMLSKDVQQNVINQTGYISVYDMQVKRSMDGSVSKIDGKANE